MSHLSSKINIQPVSADVKALALLACKSPLDNIKKIHLAKDFKRLPPHELFSYFTASIIKQRVVFTR
jgi:hypothetical protein